jgi:hypothetical protein
MSADTGWLCLLSCQRALVVPDLIHMDVRVILTLREYWIQPVFSVTEPCYVSGPLTEPLSYAW